MAGMFEYLRDVVKARLGHTRESFGATVLLDWGDEGAVLIDGTTPVPSNVTAKSDTPADLVIRAPAEVFERALFSQESPGPERSPERHGLIVQGDAAVWNVFGPAVLCAQRIAPPAPPFPVQYPALTAAQRLHLEVNGYVVVENAISADLCRRLTAEIHDLQARADAGEFPQGTGATLYSNRRDYFRVLQPHLCADACLEYVIEPRNLGFAREATGGARIRYMEADCQIRRPNPDEADTPMISADGLHRGVRGNYHLELHGRYRAPFVKMLTNLTDLGPDDGGTVVVPGTHRSNMGVPDVVRALSRDPSMVRRVEAPAGSTLVFFETLVHGSGIIRSGRERLMMIAAYGPSFVQASKEGVTPESLWERLDRSYESLFLGTETWNWHPDLDDPPLQA
jgi:ectoine hydroxylase-related dioxygenase (phytanoyl-CoA dioxygenase family)